MRVIKLSISRYKWLTAILHFRGFYHGFSHISFWNFAPSFGMYSFTFFFRTKFSYHCFLFTLSTASLRLRAQFLKTMCSISFQLAGIKNLSLFFWIMIHDMVALLLILPFAFCIWKMTMMVVYVFASVQDVSTMRSISVYSIQWVAYNNLV